MHGRDLRARRVASVDEAKIGGRVRHQVELSRIHESKNTQSFRLRFRALLTRGGDPKMPLHGA